MKELLFVVSFFFFSIASFACSCAPFNSFCETKNGLFLYDVFVYGKVLDTNSLSIRIEKIELLEGLESRDTLTVWNDTFNLCETLKATTLGFPGDTLFVLLDRIDSVEFNYDVIGDYRTPSLFCYQTRLKVQNDTVRGLINAVYFPPPPIPPLANFYSNIALSDFRPFLKSNTGSCIEIRDSTFDYIPLPEGQARWRENGDNAAGECWEQQYSLGLDTLINNLVYQRVNSIKVVKNRILPNNCGGFKRVEINGEGFYRNDLSNRKVFYVNPSEGIVNDTLLYDFNLEVGDTLTDTYLYNRTFFQGLTVSNIDFVFMGGKYRRRYEINIPFSGGVSPYIIEGVGSTLGLLSPLYPQLCCSQELECMIEDNVSVYPDSSYNCLLVTNIKKNDLNDERVTLFPNPTNGIVNLQSNIVLDRIEIYNIEGKLLQNLDGNITKLELPDQSGLYFLKVISGSGEIYFEKLIKQ